MIWDKEGINSGIHNGDWNREHSNYRDQVEFNYVKMYNQDSTKLGAAGAFNNLRGIRQEFRDNYIKYDEKIQELLKEITLVYQFHKNNLPFPESDDVQLQHYLIKRVVHCAMLGENRVPLVKDEILDFIKLSFKRDEQLMRKVESLFVGIKYFSEVSLHDMVLSRLIGWIKKNGFPRQIKFNKEVKPKDKSDWIKSEYENHVEKYKTEHDWAEATTEKFKKTFSTPLGSPESMKRYAKYRGLN